MMQAMQLAVPKSIEVDPLAAVELPVPQPGVGQIRIKVHACGICHTDLHTVEGRLTCPACHWCQAIRSGGWLTSWALGLTASRSVSGSAFPGFIILIAPAATVPVDGRTFASMPALLDLMLTVAMPSIWSPLPTLHTICPMALTMYRLHLCFAPE